MCEGQGPGHTLHVVFINPTISSLISGVLWCFNIELFSSTQWRNYSKSDGIPVKLLSITMNRLHGGKFMSIGLMFWLLLFLWHYIFE